MISLICKMLKTNKQTNRKPELIENRNWWLPEVRDGRVGKMGEGGQKGQTPSYKMNKS